MRRNGPAARRHVLRGSASACSRMTTPALSRLATSSPSLSPAAQAAHSRTKGSSSDFIDYRRVFCTPFRRTRLTTRPTPPTPRYVSTRSYDGGRIIARATVAVDPLERQHWLPPTRVV